jgi:hypothetical protein
MPKIGDCFPSKLQQHSEYLPLPHHDSEMEYLAVEKWKKAKIDLWLDPCQIDLIKHAEA